MTTLTCAEVESQIELYAADECDAATADAVARHLAECPACTEAHEQAQQTLGLLTQRFQEAERLQRLWTRLAAEPKRRRRPNVVLRFAPRIAALAATVLLTFGLAGWLRPLTSLQPDGSELTASLHPGDSRGAPDTGFAPGAPAMDKGMHEAMAAVTDKMERFAATLELTRKAPAEFRRELEVDAGTERLPPPPEVHQFLELRNDGDREIRIDLDDDRAELTLDLDGPGAVHVAAPPEAKPPFPAEMIRLAPGERRRLTIERLVYGSRRAVRYAYWIQPGDYSLTVRLRAPVATNPPSGIHTLTVTAGPIRFQVEAER